MIRRLWIGIILLEDLFLMIFDEVVVALKGSLRELSMLISSVAKMLLKWGTNAVAQMLQDADAVRDRAYRCTELHEKLVVY